MPLPAGKIVAVSSVSITERFRDRLSPCQVASRSVTEMRPARTLPRPSAACCSSIACSLLRSSVEMLRSWAAEIVPSAGAASSATRTSTSSTTTSSRGRWAVPTPSPTCSCCAGAATRRRGRGCSEPLSQLYVSFEIRFPARPSAPWTSDQSRSSASRAPQRRWSDCSGSLAVSRTVDVICSDRPGDPSRCEALSKTHDAKYLHPIGSTFYQKRAIRAVSIAYGHTEDLSGKRPNWLNHIARA